ncbi:MAG: hypothetical protein ACYC11_03900 [Bellilinea sp.]
MLTFLPAILLLITALAVFLLRYLPRGTGYSWLTAVTMTLLVWGGVLALHWYTPPVVDISSWQPYDPGTADAIRFSWNSVSWLYSLVLVSVCLVVLMTSGARLQLFSNPLSWSANLVITAAGLVAVLADTSLAMVLSWVLLDGIDLILVQRLSRSWKYSARGITVFVVRTISIFLMITALVVQWFIGIPLEFETMSPLASLFVLLSLGLRLGLVPLNLPYKRDFPFQRELVSNLRLTAHIVGLAALARIPQLSVPGNWLPTLYTVTIIACLYGAAMWVASQDEISGRPYWLLTLSGLAFICVLQGRTEQSAAWGLVMAVSGAGLFLFSSRARGLISIPILGMVALSGLPFTPASIGWDGLVVVPFGIGDAMLIITVALLLFGYGRHALKSGDDFSGLDGWVRVIYPVGFILLLASGWVGAGLGLSGGLSAGIVWPAAAASIISALFWAASWRLKTVAALPLYTQAVGVINSGLNLLIRFLRLSWLYEFLWSIYQGLRRLVAFLTLLFEGEGGLLWSFLLLVLMLTIIFAETGL